MPRNDSGRAGGHSKDLVASIQRLEAERGIGFSDVEKSAPDSPAAASNFTKVRPT